MQPTHFAGPAANPMPARKPKTPIVIPPRVAERAATRYVEDESGCFISTYSTASHGYAQIGWTNNPGDRRSSVTLCHRGAWVYYHGAQIPDGMTIDHLCHNRQCVNPDHLRLLSNFENARRTAGHGKSLHLTHGCRHTWRRRGQTFMGVREYTEWCTCTGYKEKEEDV